MNNRIRELREELKISQIDLAKVFNITSATISQYELGKRFPDRETLCKLADYFNVSIDYLLGRTQMRNIDSGCSLDVSGLPEEAIKQVKEYIELIRLKYKQEKVFEKK